MPARPRPCGSNKTSSLLKTTHQTHETITGKSKNASSNKNKPSSKGRSVSTAKEVGSRHESLSQPSRKQTGQLIRSRPVPYRTVLHRPVPYPLAPPPSHHGDRNAHAAAAAPRVGMSQVAGPRHGERHPAGHVVDHHEPNGPGRLGNNGLDSEGEGEGEGEGGGRAGRGEKKSAGNERRASTILLLCCNLLDWPLTPRVRF